MEREGGIDLAFLQEDDAGLGKLQPVTLSSGFRLLMRNLPVIPVYPHGHIRIPLALAFDVEDPALYPEDRVRNALLDLAFIFLSHAYDFHVFRKLGSKDVVHKRDEEMRHLLRHRLEDGIVHRIPAHECFPLPLHMRQQDAGSIA